MHELIASVGRNITAHRLLENGEGLLVAVSGGVDSMVLLAVLHALSAQHRWRLTVAHFNHGLRGRAADADERFVQRTAAQLGLPFVRADADVRAQARAEKVSIEMAARTLRHRFLVEAARRLRIRRLALAHHADDQVELFFLRLFRGAGGDGLAGMRWESPAPADATRRVIRPLLNLAKADLERFARDERIACRPDVSNASHDFVRNRIRLELLPRLRRDFAPRLDLAVTRAMELIGADAGFAAAAAVAWLERPEASPFSGLPVAIQRRVLQSQLTQLGITPGFELIEHLRLAPDEPWTLEPQRRVTRDAAGRVHAESLPRASFVAGERLVQLGGPTGEVHWGGRTVRWRRLTRKPGPLLKSLANRAPGCEWFDAERVGPGLVLRHWRAGDRFQPIGLAAPVKLQDWFVNAKVSRTERHARLIATTRAGEIFWVEGTRIGQACKVTARTHEILEWRCEARPLSAPG